jgi:hypothetical protein
MGIPVCQDLYNVYGYTNIFRMFSPGQPNKKTKKIGFPTTHTNKPILVKCLLDHIQVDGITIYSSRLYQQLTVYVHLTHTRTGNVEGTGNHDDLPMAFAMALLGIREAVQADQSALIPAKVMDPETSQALRSNVMGMDDMLMQGGMHTLAPLIVTGEDPNIVNPEVEFRKFICSLGGLPMQSLMRSRFNPQPPNK